MRGCIRFVYVAYWLMASSFKLLFISRPSSLFIRKKSISLLGERKWINPSHSQLHHRRTLCGYPLEGVRRSCRGCFDYRLFIMSPTPIYLAQGEAQRKEWTKYVRETVKNGAPKAMSNSLKFPSTFWRSGKDFTGSGGGLIKKIRNGTKKKWYLYKVLAYEGRSLWPGVG